MPTSSCSSNSLPGRIFVVLFWLLLLQPKLLFAEQLSIAVHASSQLLANAPCRLAVADAISLLEQAFPHATVTLNGRAAQVSFYLPTLNTKSPAPFAEVANRPATGDDSFQWRSHRMGATTTTLYLSARTPQGGANGIYALLLVRQHEMRYRYPISLLAQQRASLTAYPFGYLYPVTNLFFWEREEEQVRQERFDALFMNLWDMRRTLGLGSLFFRQ